MKIDLTIDELGKIADMLERLDSRGEATGKCLGPPGVLARTVCEVRCNKIRLEAAEGRVINAGADRF